MSGAPSNSAEGDGHDFVLRPPECPSREELEREHLPPIVLPAPEAAPPRWPQFSVADVMIVMVGVAAGLAGGSWMPTDLFAALLGLATLLGLLVVSWHPPDSHLGKLLWATFVIAYFVSVLAAIFRPPPAGP